MPLAALAAPAQPATLAAETDNPPSAAVTAVTAVTALTPELLYQILLAEMAGQRGNIPLAVHLYTDLAKTTRDARIARRATEIALYVRQTELAMESAQIWVAAEPESAEARQAVASLYLNANQPEAALPHLAKLLTIKLPPPANSDGPAPPADTDADADANLIARLNQIYHLLTRYADKAAAQQLVEQLTANYPNLAEAQLIRAQASLDAKDEARALEIIDQAIRQHPDWEPGVLFKAQMQRRISSKQATQTLLDFLERHPKSSEVRLAYARILIGDKHYEAARREFGILLDANRDNPEALYPVALLSMQLNDLPTAEKHLKHLLELSNEQPRSRINTNLLRYYLGQIAEDRKRETEALDWYAQVTPGEQYLPALGRASALLVKSGRLDEARALLRKSAENTPQERIALLVAEAQLLANNNQLEAGYKLLSQQLIVEPDQPTLLYEAALLAERLKQHDVMERNLRRLIRIKPDDAHAYNALGYSLADQGQRLDEAAKLIDKGLALSPDDAYILDSKGWLLYRRGEKQAAMDILRKAYALRPDAEIAAHLGEVLWVSGLQEEASKTWQESAKANPDNQLLKDTMQKFLGGQMQQPVGSLGEPGKAPPAAE